MEEIKLPNQERIRTRKEENYKYLEILEADIDKQAEMKKKSEKRVLYMNEKTTQKQPLW